MRMNTAASAQGDGDMLWDSRMASGVYADGMHDVGTTAGATREADQQRVMAGRRKCGSYLFGAPQAHASGARQAGQLGALHRSQSPGRGDTRERGTFSAPGRDREACDGGRGSTVTQGAERLSEDWEVEVGVGGEVSPWRTGTPAQRSRELQDELQAAVGRVARREELAFERLAGVAVATLERDFRSRMRHVQQDGSEGAREMLGDVRGREAWCSRGAVVCVPTQAGASMASVAASGQAKPVEGAQGKSGEDALREQAEQAAARRRRQRWQLQQQRAAQQRWHWREGGMTPARDVLWAQEVLDRVAGQQAGADVAAVDAGRRPCTGAPVLPPAAVRASALPLGRTACGSGCAHVRATKPGTSPFLGFENPLH